MIWIETRKAVRSRMPIWTAVGSLFMPLGIAFLIFVARNPEVSAAAGPGQRQGQPDGLFRDRLASLPGLLGQMVAAGGFFLFVLIISWVFGREFVDGTLKDMLAVPVRRSSILLAKFLVVAVWSALLTLLIFAVGMVTGAVIGAPRRLARRLCSRAAPLVLAMACLVVAVALPFALFASVGRGYLLPIGVAILALMLANLWRSWVGRVLPLGGAGAVRAGQGRSAAGQLLDRPADWAGGSVRDVPLVEARRPEPLRILGNPL